MKLNKVCVNRTGQNILKDLNVELPEKGMIAMLGANGAGKSTLLKLMAGLIKCDKGTISHRLNSCFLMPEPAVFYPYLTVQEQLLFTAQINGVTEAQQRVSQVTKLWQLNQYRNHLTKHLSLGYKQRLSLAQLDLSDAQLLLMDEPMNGMDPEVLQIFKTQIEILKKQKLIVMATHIMQEVQALADWVLVIYQGTVIYSNVYDQGTGFQQIYQSAVDTHQAKQVNGVQT